MMCDKIFSWASTCQGHRNSPQKSTQQVEKPLGTVKTELQTMICDKIVFWASTCWGTPKQSLKTYSAGRKTARYSQIRATVYDLGRNHLLGISVSRYTEIVLKNVLIKSKTPRYSQNRATDYDLRQKFLLGIGVSRHTELVPKNVLSG